MNDQFSEMDKTVERIKKETEKRVEPTIEMTVKVLKAITDKFNLPEHEAFYRLLLQRPEITQYGEQSIR